MAECIPATSVWDRWRSWLRAPESVGLLWMSPQPLQKLLRVLWIPEAPGLTERLLDGGEGGVLDRQVRHRAVGLLTLRLEERVADPDDVAGVDAVAHPVADRPDGGHGVAADRLHVHPLAGVAVGVDVGHVLPGHVDGRAACGVHSAVDAVLSVREAAAHIAPSTVTGR